VGRHLRTGMIFPDTQLAGHIQQEDTRGNRHLITRETRN
jgi:hypothetical protein